MQDTEHRDATHPRDNGASQRNDERSSSNGSGPELNADQDLIYRLKQTIDQRGRYSFRLQDMVAGFAAGQNISTAAAQRNIEDRFTEEFGVSPRDYLDKHYNDRREQGFETRQPRQRNSERDRGR